MASPSALYLLDTNHGIKAVGGQGVTVFTYLVPNGIFLQQATGNVGLSDTAPLCKLSTGTNLAPIKVSTYDGSSTTCYGIGVATNNLTFGASIDPSVGTPQMTLSSAGTLGLGISSAVDYVTISGIPAAGYGQFRLMYGNYGFFIRHDGSNVYFMLTASGSPAGGWSSPFPIMIDCSTKCIGMRVNPNSSYGVHVDSLLSDNVVNAAYYAVPAGNGSTGVFRVQDSAGSSYYNCSFSGGIMYTYVSVSDVRLKKNIQSFKRGLKEILGLRPTAFEYIDGPEGTHYNVIAQETQEVFPEAVKEVEVSVKGEKGTMLNIVDQPIIMALINALQELAQRIKALEERVA
jgi:hypothetical protein